jgi:DNA topoisomerase-1
MLADFYGPFAAALKDADIEGLIAEAHDLSALETERCPVDGGRLVARGGFFGPFIACENHPKECKYTRPLRGERKAAVMTDQICHECGSPMVIRQGRSGEFLGCSKFPKCRGTRSMPTGVKCPKDGGDIAVRRSKKRGKAFYGCANYPAGQAGSRGMSGVRLCRGRGEVEQDTWRVPPLHQLRERMGGVRSAR